MKGTGGLLERNRPESRQMGLEFIEAVESSQIRNIVAPLEDASV
ncbi:MAG: hypothetical protein PF503_07485 [Desulfobacula sp.]|jgi:hypothetical protein|nr:hypothetical protein [Desulfobacula sp.]